MSNVTEATEFGDSIDGWTVLATTFTADWGSGQIDAVQRSVPAVPYKEMRGREEGMSSAPMRERVLRARERQRSRGFYNAEIPPSELPKLCALDEAGERTLEMAVRRLNLSARAHDRVLKVARTIDDIGGSEGVSARHLAEAVQYRSLDRSYWGN